MEEKRWTVDTGGVVSRKTSVAARDEGRYWIVESRERPGREIVLTPSSSKSSVGMPTTEWTGLRALDTVVFAAVLDTVDVPLTRLAVVRESVID